MKVKKVESGVTFAGAFILFNLKVSISFPITFWLEYRRVTQDPPGYLLLNIRRKLNSSLVSFGEPFRFCFTLRAPEDEEED